MNKNLYFKQGLKSILKNKIQLVILLILSFMFSFLFTSWITVTQNFFNSFDSITSNFKKPNYVYSEKVSNTSAVLDQERNQFIPLYDLIQENDKQESEYIYIYDELENKFETSPNFLLTGDNTFISKSFQSDDFKKIYQNLFSGDYGKAISSLKNDAITIADSKYKIDYSWNLFSENIYKDFIRNTTFILLKNYVEDLKNNKNYISTSLLKKYFDKNSKLMDDFIFNNSYKNIDEWIENNEFKNEWNNNNEIAAYIYNALETLPILILNNLNNFFISQFQTYVGSLKENQKVSYKSFNEYFSFENRPSISLGEKDSINKNMKTSFEYIFGIPLGKEILNDFYVNKTFRKTSYFFGSDASKLNFLLQSEQKGLYGFTNNFFIKENEKQQLSGIVFDSNKYIYSRVPYKSTYSSSIGGFNLKLKKLNYKNKTLASIRLEHFDMAAKISNVNYYLREESFTYDPIAKLNYRFVVVDDWKKIKIISGDVPSDYSIYISEQFKTKNKKLKKININGFNVKVNGVASDALTYFQIADIDLPIIDKDQSCIVYLSKRMLEKIFTYEDGEGLSTNFSNNFFIFGKDKNVKDFFNLTFWNNDNMRSEQYEFVSFQNFKNSNWNLGWKIISATHKALIMVGIISFVSIAAIVFYTMGIIIGKNINQNKTQLKNLMIQGAENKKISTSYLGYAMLIVLISFTLGYVLGSLLQPVFIKIFTTYAVVERTGINFSWLAFLIIFIFIGAIILFVNYIATYICISRIKDKQKNKLSLDQTINKKIKLNFKTKLHFLIFFQGKYQFVILGSLMFFASLIISSFGIFINSFNKYIDESKNIINYDNQYNMNDPIYNEPFSKKSVTAWEGFGHAEQTGDDIKKIVSTVYNDLDKYEDSVSQSSIIPKLIYSNNKIDWTVKNVSENNSFISTMANIFISNATNVNGKSFSIGTFEQFKNYLLHAYINPDTGKSFNDGEHISKERLSKVATTNKTFESYIPMVLKMLFGNDSDFKKSDDWREMLLNVARALLPNSFAKKYVTNERKTQFYFEMNAENYIPDREDLATVTEATDSHDKKIFITGLEKNQKDIKISGNPFVSNKVISEIKNNISNKVYDSSTKTLTIPVIVNENNLSQIRSNESINVFTPGLTFKNKFIIPENSWAYLNYSEAHSKNENIKNEDSEWLKVSDTDTSKYNYFNSFDEHNNLKPNSQFFIKSQIENNKVTNNIRPYYNYNDVMVIIPKKLVPNINDLFITHSYNAATSRRFDIKSLSDATATAVKNNWYGSIDNNLVPEFVKQSWGDGSGDYWWIAPYNLNYSYNFNRGFFGKNNGQPGPLDVMSGNLNTWIDDAVTKSGSPLKIKNILNPNEKIKKIKLKPIASINSYNKDLVIADQKLINLIKGYDVEDIVTKNISSIGDTISTYKSGNSKIDVYNLKKPEDVLENNYNLEELKNKNLIVQKWFNTKLSRVDEPLNLTAGMSGSLNNDVGIGMLFHDGINSVKPGYKDVDLVSFKLRTIMSVNEIAYTTGIFIVIAIILICSLVIFVISDLFVSKYNNILKLLKIIGYKRSEQIYIIMLPQFFVAFIAIVVGSLIPMLFVQNVLDVFNKIDIKINAFNPWYLIFGITIALLVVFAIGNAVTIRNIFKMKTR